MGILVIPCLKGKLPWYSCLIKVAKYLEIEVDIKETQ